MRTIAPHPQARVRPHRHWSVVGRVTRGLVPPGHRFRSIAWVFIVHRRNGWYSHPPIPAAKPVPAQYGRAPRTIQNLRSYLRQLPNQSKADCSIQ